MKTLMICVGIVIGVMMLAIYACCNIAGREDDRKESEK